MKDWHIEIPISRKVNGGSLKTIVIFLTNLYVLHLAFTVLFWTLGD